MNPFVASFFLAFLTEMGDKSQILVLFLALRFKKPLQILAGVFVATLANLSLASWLGAAIAATVGPVALKWVLGASFFAFAAWILIPEKDEEEAALGSHGAFWTTAVTFFFAEMGDKTQLAVIAIGARYAAPLLVTLGATAGILAADSLAVIFGERLSAKLSMLWVRRIASGSFVLFGLYILLR